MDERDKEIYLYQMRYAQYLFEKRGKEALAELEEYEMEKMERIWDEIGEKKGRSLKALRESLWDSMKDEMKFEAMENGEGELEIHCTYCPFAELAIQNGMREIGFSKFCMSDYGIVKGFNKNIEFGRTKTLMEGDDCCNHHYRLKN